MEITRKRLEAYQSEKAEIQELRCKLHTEFLTPQLKEILEFNISRLEQRCRDVEQWIENIPDSITRRIFRMYYEEGQNQKDIAKKIHIDQSRVSRKIREYIS